MKETEFLYGELSYKIIGALYDVAHELGFSHREKFSEKAVAKALTEKGLHFNEQLPVKVHYKKEPVGIYYYDFLVEEKIVLELKVKDSFSKKDIDQLFAYLKAQDLKLGIIAHFTKNGVKFKRIVNLY